MFEKFKKHKERAKRREEIDAHNVGVDVAKAEKTARLHKQMLERTNLMTKWGVGCKQRLRK